MCKKGHKIVINMQRTVNKIKMHEYSSLHEEISKLAQSQLDFAQSAMLRNST